MLPPCSITIERIEPTTGRVRVFGNMQPVHPSIRESIIGWLCSVCSDQQTYWGFQKACGDQDFHWQVTFVGMPPGDYEAFVQIVFDLHDVRAQASASLTIDEE